MLNATERGVGDSRREGAAEAFDVPGEGLHLQIDSIWRTRLSCKPIILGLLGAVIACASAQAQPQTNSLIPGIAPLAPRRAPGETPAPSPSPTKGAAPVASPSASDPASSYDYVLGAGDKLRVIVFGEDTLSNDFVVAGNGTISFPLIGTVPAAGKTVGDVQEEINSALANGYLKNPKVSVQVDTFRPYFILGEVAKPGEYPYIDRITVMNAIASAGGFSYRANHKYVFLKKAAGTKAEKVRLTDDLEMAPGDTVRVVERYF